MKGVRRRNLRPRRAGPKWLLLLWPKRLTPHGPARGRQGPLLEIFTPVVMSISAVLLTTLVLSIINSYLVVPHLILGYLLPTVFIAIYFGSTIAVLTAFASGLAAAYFLFAPKFSFYIADSLQVAELGFVMLLAVIASKAVGVMTEDLRDDGRRSLRKQR